MYSTMASVDHDATNCARNYGERLLGEPDCRDYAQRMTVKWLHHVTARYMTTAAMGIRSVPTSWTRT